jgi:hypothetical protein
MTNRSTEVIHQSAASTAPGSFRRKGKEIRDCDSSFNKQPRGRDSIDDYSGPTATVLSLINTDENFDVINSARQERVKRSSVPLPTDLALID